jgi:hypothetical protein
MTLTDLDKQKIRKAMKEMSDSFTRVSAEKDLQKEISSMIAEETGVAKRDFNKLAKIYHASSLLEEAARNDEFMEFANEVMSTPALT